MLMTLTATHEAVTDLGFLLRKNSARPQSSSLNFGKAHVFYPEATPERCTVALLVEVEVRRHYDAQSGIQREMGNAARWQDPPPRSSLRVDARGVSDLGKWCRHALRLQRALPACRPGRFGVWLADADGGV